MEKENISISMIDNIQDAMDKVSNHVKDILTRFKGQDFFVCNRNANSSFISTFGDSVFTYDKGVILLERMYKGKQCSTTSTKYKSAKQEDIDLIKEFEDFSKSIKNVGESTDQEVQETEHKIQDYTSRIEAIKSNLEIVTVKNYKDSILVSLDELDDEFIESVSSMYVSLAINLLTGLSWSNLKDTNLVVTTMPYRDYVDIILFPVKITGED